MTVSRKSILLDTDQPVVLHCISRCVRRSFLCGYDRVTRKDYKHRRAWIYKEIKRLSGIFSVQVLACAVMSNHYHIVIRLDPKKSKNWSKQEVVRRWNQIYPVNRDKNRNPMELSTETISEIILNEEKINEWRLRLCSISWFMKQINEPLARRSNYEDRCTGRFWEGRFKCQRLTDQGAVLACMTYVDLNPIRAGIAQTPEESCHTSAQDRIKAKVAAETLKQLPPLETESECSKIKMKYFETLKQRADWLAPIESIRHGDDDLGWLLTLEEYLQVIDITGRCIKEGKKGYIPADLSPILLRMNLDQDHWLKTVQNYGSRFHRVIGSVEKMAETAKKAGQQWFKGLNFSRLVYRPS